MLRNKGAGVEFSELEQLYCDKKRKRWLRKYNFDLRRHDFLKNSLERIDERLAIAEEQRFK